MFTERAGADAITGSGREALATVSGDVYVSTAIRVAETLLKKPGGFTKNDMLPPAWLIDNMPNWEYGVLTELRDTVRSLRNEFSRSQSQSIESDALKRADSDFAFSSDAWFLPSAEEMYKDGVKQLESYLAALMNKDSNAGFFERADNLRSHLEVVGKRLGSYGQQLAASVADPALASTLGARMRRSREDESRRGGGAGRARSHALDPDRRCLLSGARLQLGLAALDAGDRG